MIKINPRILSKTVKVITPKTEKVEEAQIRGTIVFRNNEQFVQLDGAPDSALTPITDVAEGASDAGFVHGDRVLVLLKNHQAIVTKNLTVGLQAQAAKEAGSFVTTITDEGITAQRIIANDTFTNTLRANHIKADDIIAGMATIETLDTNYAHITEGVIDNAKIGVADVNDLSANYAHITEGVIDNAKIGYADVDELDANYAQIDMANVNNAWIEQGSIKKAEVFDENVFDLSGNRATISRLDASKINVANLRADNLIVRRINGQPVVGGYTLISNTSPGYESKNPQELGWYEFVNAQWVLSTDTTVDITKAYYQEGDEVSLYDQAYIDDLKNDLQQQIDGAVETFTGSVVPTLVNYPYTDWYDTSVTPIHDERAKHVGDIYYVTNSSLEEDGYAYRFAFDETQHAYDWVLIKDSAVTRALSDISELQTFESETTSWIDKTDEGLETIRTNHTVLSGKVDKTVKESVQLWFTKANTTAPAKPTAEVTSTSTAGNAWRKVVPAWNASYPNYYYCWQYKFVDGTFGWSDVVRDIAMGETQGTARDAKNTADAALPASTFTTFESTTFKNVKDTVDEQTTKFTNMTTRLGLNSDGTAGETDIVAKESALEHTVNGISTRVGKTEMHLAGMYATSSTAAGTAAKVATIVPTLSNYELANGAMVTVKFTAANTTASPTLNLNGTGAKAIKTYSGGNLTEAEYKWKAGSTFTFTYNGTNWLMQDSTASVRMTNAETEIQQTADNVLIKATRSGASAADKTAGGTSAIGLINVSPDNVVIAAKHVDIAGAAIFNNYSTTQQMDNAIGTAVNGIEVGGNNLLSIYDWENGSWNSTTGAHVVNDQRIRNTKDGNYISVTPNQEYTISRHTTNSSYTYQVVLYAYDNSGNFVPSDSKVLWQVNYPFIWKPTTATRLEVGIRHSDDTTISPSEAVTARIKIEKGNKATDYSLSAEDISEGIQVGGRNLYIIGNSHEGFLAANGAIGTMNQVRKEHYSDYLSVSEGETVIFQAWGTPLNGDQMWMAYELYNSSKTYVGSRPSKMFGVSDVLQHDTFEIAIPSGIAYLRVSARMYNDGLIKVEKGTKATDWTPAPEDVQGEIDARKSVHTLMSASAGNTYANILTWTAEGYSNGWWIDVTKTPLTGIKVGDTCRVAYKVTDMNNAYVYVVGEMTSISGATLTMTMHGLDTTIIDGGNILTNSIGANQIKANAVTSDKLAANSVIAGKIKAGAVTADKLDATTINASKKLTIGAMSDAAAETILNSEIQVGGKNLFGYGSECKTLDGFSVTGAWDITTEDGFVCAHTSGALQETRALWSKIPFTPKPNEEVVFSCYVKIKNISYGTTNPMCEVYFSGQTIDGSWKSADMYDVCLDGVHVTAINTRFASYISDTKWHHIAFVARWPNANFTNNIAPSIYMRDTTGDIYVRNIKYERGNKYTDWTPAPEDVETKTIYKATYSKAVTTRNLGAGTYVTTIQEQNFAKNFCIRTDFKRVGSSRQCMVSCYSGRPSVGVELSAAGQFRLYSLSDDGTPTDEYCGSVVGVGSSAKAVIRWNKKLSQFEWLLEHDGKQESGSYKPNGTYSGTSSTYVRLGGDYRDSSGGGGTFTPAWSQTEMPAIYYESATETSEGYSYSWELIESRGGNYEIGDIFCSDVGAKATNYITDISSAGIYISPANQSPSSGSEGNSVKVDGNGMEVYKGNTSVAKYGDSARIGKAASKHISLDATNGMQVFTGTESDSTNVAQFNDTVRVGKKADTNIVITPAGTDSGIKMNVKNKAGTSSVRIADIGFDSSQGYETDKNFPKGAWFTFGDRAGTAAQRGYYSLVSGFNCIASHNASVSFGINNKVYAPCGFAVGMENEVGDSSKTSQNSYTESSIGNCSAAIGYGLKTGSGANQLVCGEYNQVLANQTPFIVGIGPNGSSRRNGFIVQNNGNAILYGTLTQGSDRRLKEHIAYLGDDAVEFVNKLKPAFYIKDGGKHVGFYAQDVKEADKWHCMTGEMNGFMTLGYTEIIAPLVKYVQKLEERIEELERSK